MTTTLARFDLDHTLPSGDRDLLRCQYLVAQDRPPAAPSPHHARMDAADRSA